MYRTLLGILAAFACAILGVGLTFSATVERDADFRFVNGTEPATLDPHRLTGSPGGRIVNELFEGLTRREPKTLKPAPGVAESWEMSADQKRYTFYLRKDARWTDGRPITSEDFVYSWRRLLDPKLGAEYAYLLHMVRDAEAFNTYQGLSETITERFVPALDRFIKEAGDPIDARRWHRFLLEQDVHAALKNATDAEIAQLLAPYKSPIRAERITRFRRAVLDEAKRLKTAQRAAAKRFGTESGIIAQGPHTLIVELKAPTPYFLEITSFYSAFPVPRHIVEKSSLKNRWFLPDHIVSNGPFRLKSWRVNDRLRLEKSSTYWGKERVRSELVDAYPIENLTTALNLYLTGEVDWLPDYPLDLVREIKKRPDHYSGPGMIVYYYRFNCTKKPFTDRRVRQALSLAIDRKLIVTEVMGSGELPAYHFVPPGMPGYEPPKSALRFDVKRARELLAEAGYPGGRGFPEVGILFNTLQAHRKIAEFVADQLRQNLGISVTSYNQEWQSFLATTRALDYDIARAGWIGDYHDPNTFLDMFVTNGGNNQTGFSSAKYDLFIRVASDVDSQLESSGTLLNAAKHPQQLESLIEQLRSAPNDLERNQARAKLRMAVLAEAESLLVQDEFPIMPIYFYVNTGLVRPEVKGFHSKLTLPDGSVVPNLQDLHPLESIEVSKSADPGASE